VKVSRDYLRYAKKMAEIKNSMERAERLHEASEKAHAEGEMAAKIEIARKMKNAERPIDEIAAFTGLPLETIEQIG